MDEKVIRTAFGAWVDPEVRLSEDQYRRIGVCCSVYDDSPSPDWVRGAAASTIADVVVRQAAMIEALTTTLIGLAGFVEPPNQPWSEGDDSKNEAYRQFRRGVVEASRLKEEQA